MRKKTTNPVFRSGEHFIQVNPDFFSTIEPQQFTAAYWRDRGMITGEAGGRNKVYFIHDGSRAMLLRHYYRGGLIAKISLDHFIYIGLSRVRSIREFQMLQQMCDKGLPVPRPCAAAVLKKGLFFQCDILVETLPESRDLAHILGSGESLTAHQWNTIGATIALFHLHEVHHRDLNCHNILLDAQDKCWLVDFDRCSWRKNPIWQKKSLARLHRSFVKELKRINGFNWKPQDWDDLMAGYRRQISCPVAAITAQ
jgi:3-deoxy-D-manno-octulosonic-acid transferase